MYFLLEGLFFSLCALFVLLCVLYVRLIFKTLTLILFANILLQRSPGVFNGYPVFNILLVKLIFVSDFRYVSSSIVVQNYIILLQMSVSILFSIAIITITCMRYITQIGKEKNSVQAKRA